jgi:hypothetical protein
MLPVLRQMMTGYGDIEIVPERLFETPCLPAPDSALLQSGQGRLGRVVSDVALPEPSGSFAKGAVSWLLFRSREKHGYVAGGVVAELIDDNAGFPFRASTAPHGNEATEPGVPLLCAAEHEDAAPLLQGKLGAYEQLHAQLSRPQKRSYHPVHAVTIGNRNSMQP